MKRKGLVIAGIVLAVLVLCVILIWPAAPLWARLGLRPFCIQGSWPHLEIVPCPTETAAVPPRPLPTPGEGGPIPVIVDDDGSPDGTLALLYFLRNPLFDVRAVTISCGEAHPELFAPHLQRLLAGLGRADIPVGVGRATPLEGSNGFPDPWRQASDSFWGIDYPEADASLEPVPAAELIVETLNHSTQPVMVFVSGTHTNLAEALRLDPGITDHIRDVYIMGGNLYGRGNIEGDWSDIHNAVAEWNIWVDPLAADEVFASGLPLHLTPLEATDQVRWTQADAHAWAASGTPEGALAGDLLQWMLDSWSVESFYIFDLVAAVNASDPTLCPEVSFALDVLTAPGPDQGQTVVTDQAPNAAVCLDPDAEQVRALAAAVLGAPAPTPSPEPSSTPSPTATAAPANAPTPTVAPVLSQALVPPPYPELVASVDVRTYGGDLNDWAYDVLALADGGTLIAGQVNNTGPSHRITTGNARLIRTDAQGNVVWARDYGGDDDAVFHSVIQVGEDEYVILGSIAASYERNETDLYLVRIDGEGNEVWSHTYGGRGMDDGKMVRQTSDGGFILVGSCADEHPTGDLYQGDLLLIRTDAEGNELWRRTYGTGILYMGWGGAQAPDGGYVAAGWAARTIDDRDVFVIRTDEAGDLAWSRRWDLDTWDRDGGFDMILTSDGHVVIACIRSMDTGVRGAVLIKVDLDGNVIWARAYGEESVGHEFWDVMEEPDGGYIVAGTTIPGRDPTTGEDIRRGLIIKTDPDGEVLWQYLFDEDEYGDIILSSATLMPDGGYVFVGAATRSGETYTDMLWLRLTTDGEVIR